MRTTSHAALALAACLLAAGPSRAGIYNTVPWDQISGAMPLARFQLEYEKYLVVGDPKLPQQQQFYLERAEPLEKKDRSELVLTVDDRVNLSAAYLRLQQPEKAIRILAPIEKEGRRNFMVLANLSMAHHASGSPERAIDYAELTLKEWPHTWPGWTSSQLAWFYRVESTYLTMLRGRSREQRLNPGKIADGLDELFPGVSFVGPSGQYEAGRMDPIQYSRLPAEHAAVVEQLVVWMPTDLRLYWMLAELLNANGELVNAAAVLNNLADRGFAPKELRMHRQVLNEARQAAITWLGKMVPADEPARLLWMVSPRGGGAPGANAAWNEIGWAWSLKFMRQPRPVTHEEVRPPAAIIGGTPAARSESSKGAWAPDLRHVLVSFFTGIAVAVLGGMQIRELRRRREAVASASKE